LPVAQIAPGETVVLEDGTRIRVQTIVSNADPKVALRVLAEQDVPSKYRARLEAWKVRSPVVKFNAALSQKPAFVAAPAKSYHAWARCPSRDRRRSTEPPMMS
jgi:hypothetical protein